jgi:CRP-like cAMP-binding protein
MTNQTFAILKKTKFFSSLSDSVLESLAKNTSLQQFKKGDIIIKEATLPKGCYILLSGTGIVYTENNQAGTKYVISQVGPHSLIGELSTIVDQPSLFTVEANEDVECLFVNVETFKKLLETHPVISQVLLPMVVERVHEMIGIFMK